MERSGSTNINLYHNKIEDLPAKFEKEFDYSIITFVIHELSPDKRIKVMSSLSKISNNLIIGDYITPHPKNLAGRLNFVIEFLAGREHFNNFKHFINNGGILELTENAGLMPEKIINNRPQNTQIIVLKT